MKIIILFNLNDYLGGGEVLLLRIAERFKEKDIKFIIIGSYGNGYITDEAYNNKYALVRWPYKNSSVCYMNKKERAYVSNYFYKIFSKYHEIYIFTFCFRDIYNSIIAFKKLENMNVFLSTGIFHPNDIRYLSSYSIKKKKYLNNNQNVLKKYVNHKCAIFMNERTLYSTFGYVNTYMYQIIPLPIQMLSSRKNYITKKDSIFKIIYIGRFVNFKLSSIIMILNYIKLHPQDQLTIIGYGNCENIIKSYIKKHSIKNVNILGKIHPNELNDIILEHDIAYCMGTSALETAKYGIPTIIAPMLPKNYWRKKMDICLGIFGENKDFNLGEIDKKNNSKFESLHICINKIKNNYQNYQLLTLNHIKNFDLDKITNQYLNIIQNSNLKISEIEQYFLKAPILKYIAKKFYYNLKIYKIIKYDYDQ
jgi:hypothetical protein